MSLDALLDNSVTQERIPVDVDPRLTRAAWAGLALLVAHLGMLRVGATATSSAPTWDATSWAFTGFGHPDLARQVITTAIGAGIVGAIGTWGFTRATARGINGQLGLLFAGIVAAVPILWVIAVVVGLAMAAGVALVVLAVLTVAVIAVSTALAPVLWRLVSTAVPAVLRFTWIVLLATWTIVVVTAPLVWAVTVLAWRIVGLVLSPLKLLSR